MARGTLRWELLGCTLHGHVLVGVGAENVTAADSPFVREQSGLRWHRCLRCDGWFPQAPLAVPTAPRVPSRDEVQLPQRGKVLRDRFVLRLIAFDRAIHVVVLVIVAVALFVLASHRNTLESTYDGVMNSLLGSSGGPAALRGWLGHLRRFFIFNPRHLDDLAFVACGFAALEAVEMVGLWYAKRWAEYLTFVATCVLLPLEVEELASRLSPLKIAVLAINLAVAVFLLFAKRLFGLRGGGKAAEERRAAASGWAAFDRASPPALNEVLP